MHTPGALSPNDQVLAALREFVASTTDVFDALNGLRDLLHEFSPNVGMPVDLVRWVPIERVTPNDYNPNKVARVEMGLLLRSIMHDGYTQPVVTVWNATRVLECLCVAAGTTASCRACGGRGEFEGCFEIVDGFHRYWTMRASPALMERCKGRVPIVVIDKAINDRMASTIRHNRARGKHSVDGMANMVFQMLENGMDDAEVCNELGMEAEEIVRLKHITGFSKLFKDTKYNRAWVAKNQVMLRLRQEEKDRQKANGSGEVADVDRS